LFAEGDKINGERVYCNRYCLSDKTKVFGGGKDYIYTKDSSICRAAIHSDLIKPNTGGFVKINLSENKLDKDDIPNKSELNSIKSEDFPPDSD